MSDPASIRFQPGEIYCTQAVLEVTSPDEIASALARHISGDWGEICAEDAESNESAVVEGGQLMSIYQSRTGVVFWVITESDRSVTRILLPDDY